MRPNQAMPFRRAQGPEQAEGQRTPKVILMKSILLSAALWILIGFDDRPVVAQVRLTPPGAKDWVSVPREMIQIEKFDMKERILVMRFANKNDPDLPPSFSLSVKRNKAVLSIGGKRIRSSFDWLE